MATALAKTFLAFVVAYLLGAFTLWEIDPGAWAPDHRINWLWGGVTLSFIAIIGPLATDGTW